MVSAGETVAVLIVVLLAGLLVNKEEMFLRATTRQIQTAVNKAAIRIRLAFPGSAFKVSLNAKPQPGSCDTESRMGEKHEVYG